MAEMGEMKEIFKLKVLACLLVFLSLQVFTLTSSEAAPDYSQVVLNLKTAGLQVNQAEDLFKAGQIKEAHSLVSQLRPLLSEFTEMHSQLYESLKDDNASKLTAEQEKKQTIEFAKLRDRANYLSGMISLKQGNNREAVKHLVQVVNSQRTTGLGEKAYQSLRDIGFSPKLSIEDQI